MICIDINWYILLYIDMFWYKLICIDWYIYMYIWLKFIGAAICSLRTISCLVRLENEGVFQQPCAVSFHLRLSRLMSSLRICLVNLCDGNYSFTVGCRLIYTYGVRRFLQLRFLLIDSDMTEIAVVGRHRYHSRRSCCWICCVSWSQRRPIPLFQNS